MLLIEIRKTNYELLSVKTKNYLFTCVKRVSGKVLQNSDNLLYKSSRKQFNEIGLEYITNALRVSSFFKPHVLRIRTI